MRPLLRKLVLNSFKPRSVLMCILSYSMLLLPSYVFISYSRGHLARNKMYKELVLETQLIKVRPYCSCHKEILVQEYFNKFYVTNKAIIFFEEENANATKTETEETDRYGFDNGDDDESKKEKGKLLRLQLEYLKQMFGIETDRVFRNPRFTCDLYNELRFGPKQKVISYSLYGTHQGYYNLIDYIGNMSKDLFPDWNIRVHYDNSVDVGFVCQTECKHNQMAFCNVHRTPFKDELSRHLNLFRSNSSETITINKSHESSNNDELTMSSHYNDLSYVHGMMWRWFPIADAFVDFFSSRDTDSTLIQREKDSVQVWLGHNKLFHIMRDNPFHNVPILGGLWGHANVISRSNGHSIFAHFTQPKIQSRFNPPSPSTSRSSNPKNLDQVYLSEYVWPLVLQLNSSTIHDSYNCDLFGPAEPFPTRRPGHLYCFVSCFHPCCRSEHNQTERMADCPLECRPSHHQDWDKC